MNSIAYLVVFVVLPILVSILLIVIAIRPDLVIRSEEKRAIFVKYRWIWILVALILLAGNSMKLIGYFFL